MRRVLAALFLVLAVAAQRAAFVPELARAARDSEWFSSQEPFSTLERNAAGATLVGCLAFIAIVGLFDRQRRAAAAATALGALIIQGAAHLQRSTGQALPATYVIALAAGLFAPSAFTFATETILHASGRVRAHALAAYAILALGVSSVAAVYVQSELGSTHRETSARVSGHIAFLGAACVAAAALLVVRREVQERAAQPAPAPGPYRQPSPAANALESDLPPRVMAILPLGGAAAIASLLSPPIVWGRSASRDAVLFGLLGIAIGAVVTLVLVVRRGARGFTDTPLRAIAAAFVALGLGAIVGTLGRNESATVCMGAFVIGLASPAALSVSSAWIAAVWEPPRRPVAVALFFAVLAVVAFASASLIHVAATFTGAKVPLMLRLAEGVVALVGGLVLLTRRRETR